MATGHRATLERLVDEIWNQRRTDLMAEVFQESLRVHRGDQQIEGLDTFRELHVKPFQAAFPDLAHAIDDLVVEGDRAAMRFHGSGTQAKDFAGFAASNSFIEFQTTAFFRFEEQKIAEVWVLSSIAAALAAQAA